ncbi:hypothetical protein XM47_07085 [Catenovulum maritimum]|uniref:Carboxypeptidase Q n=1 Tax=Catenovulum maritimum TaxID=1513271 RepID=A0A0J8GSS3_9ALTE|nr:hypothetical protein XM47_07085 [Catenovulum maritimum]
MSFTLFLVFSIAHANNFEQDIEKIKQSALTDEHAYHLIESLTTEVGARLVGTDRSNKAIDWAEKKLLEIGVTQVTKQAVKVRDWQRVSAEATVTSPYSHKLVVTSLGGSVPTPETGIEAEIIRFSSIEHLKTAEKSDVAGKIVYIAKKLIQDKTGDDYIKTVQGRLEGAIVASQLGAKALIIRSITTDNSRIAHTGSVQYLADVDKIPAAAISPADADLLDRLFSRNLTPKLNLKLINTETKWLDSYNLIADITGSEKPEETVLLAAHLDSWDLGTGALDDATGVGVVIAALKQLLDAEVELKRSLRVVFFTDSLFKQNGALEYIKAHKDSLNQIVAATEMDFGSGLIWRLDTKIASSSLKFADAVHTRVSDLGVERGHNNSTSSTNVAHFIPYEVPVFHWVQDASNYFKYLHSANDTFDKVQLNAVQQNVAVLSIFSFMVANSDMQFKLNSSDKQ